MSAENRSELFIFPPKGKKCLPGVFLLARLWLSPGWGRGEGAWKGWVTLCSVPNNYNKPLKRKVLFPSWKSPCEPGLKLTLRYAATKHAAKIQIKKITHWMRGLHHRGDASYVHITFALVTLQAPLPPFCSALFGTKRGTHCPLSAAIWTEMIHICAGALSREWLQLQHLQRKTIRIWLQIKHGRVISTERHCAATAKLPLD